MEALVAKGRAKDLKTLWSDEEHKAIWELKIPQHLVRLGIVTLEQMEVYRALEKKEEVITELSDEESQETPEEMSLDMCSDDELKALAKERGIRGAHLMKRATLIERISTPPSPQE